MGVNAPADMLLFRINNLKIDKASITGESEPVEATLTPDPTTPSLVEACALPCLCHLLCFALRAFAIPSHGLQLNGTWFVVHTLGFKLGVAGHTRGGG
jgi:magnesium-transporting ATPase (P-type)